MSNGVIAIRGFEYQATVILGITVTVHLIDGRTAISMRSIWTSVYCRLVKCTVTGIPWGLCASYDVMCQNATRQAGLPPVWSQPDDGFDDCMAASTVVMIPACYAVSTVAGGWAGIACGLLSKIPTGAACKQKSKNHPPCSTP
jgi:hypothetical protein